MPVLRRLPLVIVLVALTALPALAQTGVWERLQEIAVIDQKVMMPMRDGVRLATDIFRPKTDEPVPIVFSRTPYNFNPWGDGELRERAFSTALRYVEAGYAYVVQNERGRYFSEGEWDILGPPTTDGYDALTWMAAQPWSNGKVGLIGCSSTAEWQMEVAAMNHPALAAIVPQGFGAGVGRVGRFYEQGNWYRGGAQQMLFTTWLYGVQDIQRPTFSPDLTQEDLVRVSRFYDLAADKPPVDWSVALRHLPVIDIMKAVDGPMGIYEDMMARKPNDPAWYEGGLYHDDDPINVPGFWFVSWYDVSQGPNLALYNHVRGTAPDPAVRDAQYLVIAPTTHCGFTRATANTVVGERPVGDARLDYDALTAGWFDLWLKGERNGFMDETPRVQFYTMGSNRWQSSDAWPPSDAVPMTLFLASDGTANSVFGEGRLATEPPATDSPDQFTYDPDFPVPSLGGQVCCTGSAVQGGSFDQRQMEARSDILVYTSEPFANGIEVTGTIEVTLFVSSDARDTDFTVKLVDVHPDGRAFNIDETILRARYREGFDREVFLEDGEIVELGLSPLSTSNFFGPGHRIRVEVSSSNFPRFERNLNTGGNNFDETEGFVAHNAVHHSREYPSRIVLPVRR
jgi:hypothetical protein